MLNVYRCPSFPLASVVIATGLLHIWVWTCDILESSSRRSPRMWAALIPFPLLNTRTAVVLLLKPVSDSLAR